MSGNFLRRVFLGVAAASLAFGLAVAAARNLGNTGMWWDEAAQFWVSQGLSNYSPPFAARCGVRDVIRRNRWENLDPGGFSLLVHAWTSLGTALPWLRALPFAFFVLGAAALGCLGWRLTRSAAFALAALATPALYPAGLYFAFEIRAYSMEMAGVACGALALAAALERPSPARAAALGVVCAAFLSSRYSYALVAAALLTAFVLSRAQRQGPSRERVRRAALALAPVLVAGALAWWVTLRHQVRPDMIGGPTGLLSPPYTSRSMLGRSGADGALLLRDVLSPAAVPLTFCAFFVALLRSRLYAAVAVRAVASADLYRSRGVFTALYASVLGTLALSIAAALVGVYPWDVGSRWSAYLSEVSALAAVVVVAELVALARVAPAVAARRARAVRIAGSVAALLVVAAATGRGLTYRYLAAGVRRSNVAEQIAALPPAALSAGHVLVAFYQMPVLRYLYEHGPLTGRPEYPRAYRFEGAEEWMARKPIDPVRDGVAYVIASAPIEEVRLRLPGVELRALGPAGGPPFAVIGRTGTPPL